MQQNPYKLLLILAVLLGCAALVVVWLTSGAAQNVASTIAGGAIGLAASILIQDMASREQTEMIRAVTLDAEGITPLPETFHRLKWLAFATKKPTSPTAKCVEWHFVRLTKIGGSGPRFVTYSLAVPGLLNDPVVYRATFLGTQGCVICAIAREHETTSTVTFDTAVSGAGIYFGVAYLTDWTSDRNATLMIAGSSEVTPLTLAELPQQAVAAFHRWYAKIDLNVSAAYSEFPVQASASTDQTSSREAPA